MFYTHVVDRDHNSYDPNNIIKIVFCQSVAVQQFDPTSWVWLDFPVCFSIISIDGHRWRRWVGAPFAEVLRVDRLGSWKHAEGWNLSGYVWDMYCIYLH